VCNAAAGTFEAIGPGGDAAGRLRTLPIWSVQVASGLLRMSDRF